MSNTIGTAYVQIEPTTEGISGKLNSALGAEADSAGKSAGSKFSSAMGGALKLGVSAIAGATTAVTAFGKASVDAGMTFDSSMSQVAATMGFSVNEINTAGSEANQTMSQLRDFAQQMGSSTAFSASEAADALNYMALAGYDATTSMDMLPTVLNLAAAGGIDLASASDMVTDAQSALGLSIEETRFMVDEMAAASSKSNTSVAQLGEAFLTIGANAKSLSGGTTELATALGLLADNGIKGAEGGTHLRNIMMALNPTTDKAVAAWDALGVSAYDAEGNLRPLEDTFGDLNKAMEGMTDQEKTSMLTKMFNKTDLASVNALLATSSERWKQLGDDIYYSSDAAEVMANTQLDNLEGDMTLFKSALEGAQIALSDQLAPSLREFVQFGSEGLSRMTTAFSEGGLSGLMAELGNIISDALTMIIQDLPKMVEAGSQLLGALVEGLIQNLPALIQAGMEIILQLATSIGESLPTLIPSIVEIILTITEYLIENIDLLVDAAIAIMTGLAEGIIQALPMIIEKAPEIILKLAEALVTNIPKLLEASAQMMIKLAESLITNLPQLLAKVPEIMMQLREKFISLITQLVLVGQKISETIGTALKGAWDRVTGAVSGLMQNLKNKFLETITGFADIGKNIVEGIKNGITEGWDSLKSYVSDVAKGLLDSAKDALGIHSPSREFANLVGAQIPAGIALGIRNNMGTLMNAVEDMAMSTLYNPTIGAVSTGRYAMGEIPTMTASGYNQTINVYSPTALSPSEVARQTKNATRNMVLALRGV